MLSIVQTLTIALTCREYPLSLPPSFNLRKQTDAVPETLLKVFFWTFVYFMFSSCLEIQAMGDVLELNLGCLHPVACVR
jgi:hypothetical protein